MDSCEWDRGVKKHVRSRLYVGPGRGPLKEQVNLTQCRDRLLALRQSGNRKRCLM